MTTETERTRRRRADRRGRRGEGLAALLLRLKGYRVLARRCRTVAGEIDIVAQRGGTLAFVEVKSRGDGDGGEAITPRQQARIARAAEAYLQRRPALAGADIRFDAILIGPRGLPRHLPDAWRPGG